MIKTVRFPFILTFLLVFISGYPQQICINGHAGSYAGARLEFTHVRDWLTGTEERMGFCIADDSGNFNVNLELKATRRIEMHLGAYLGYFFAEPGKTYRLVLPERLEKSPEQKLNPYFIPEEIHLGMENFSQDDLNMLIVMFEDAYGPYFEKHVSAAFARSDMQKLESDIQRMEKPFQNQSGSFFWNYRRYRYGMLKMLANQQKVQSISDEYFNNQPVLYDNPAYADLFNQVFNKYFIFYSRTDEGKQIFDDINQQGSYRALLATLSKNTNFSNDTLKELVILKQIHDEFYGNQFSRTGLLHILDSLISSTQIADHRYIGTTIKQKITRLLPGYAPPAFELMNTDGHMVTLDDLKGKYVYLNFCTCQSYTCLNEFNDIAAFDRMIRNKLTVVTIATDPQEEVLRKFLSKNKYDWEFLLYDHQPDVLKEYDIRAYPTYFLIGPDGKLILSPAPSPAEDFEKKLFDIMKERGDL
jgi:peroxiredoxin